jgi:hypothetical protein
VQQSNFNTKLSFKSAPKGGNTVLLALRQVELLEVMRALHREMDRQNAQMEFALKQLDAKKNNPENKYYYCKKCFVISFLHTKRVCVHVKR